MVNKGKYVELKGNNSYCTLYATECIDRLGKNCYNVGSVIRSLKRLDKLYGGFHAWTIWIGDLYCLKGKYQKALKYYQLPATGTATHLSNRIMNIKYQLKLPLQPPEVIATENVLTNFGRKNIHKVSEFIGILLQEKNKKCHKDFLHYLGDKHNKDRIYTFYLFEGYVGECDSYQQLFENSNFYFNKYCFYAYSEFDNFCKRVQRDAENSYREDVGVPKIGEGWISETQLYRSLEKQYVNYEVQHHGQPDWLSPQHLDIYFPQNNLGIEYQGKQHFEPVEFFGGEEAFKKTVERDKKKEKLCKENNCQLIYVLPDYDIEKVIKNIDKFLKPNEI
jgi:hypothetical protein